ncbi:MAG: hypothetical protein Q4F65_06375, partial [Propionibacteriaceae bacterium]|nr:hypothetical protein [Propionibacteriaceae bacterium]
RVRPIVDARSLDPVDSYEIPERMRHALQARWPADAFPFGSRPSRACDSDHTIPYDHDDPEGQGQTHPDLMAPLSRFTHRVKTHGGWACEQPVPGMLIWGNKHGWRWATTPTGTVLIARPEPTEYAWWKQEPPAWLDDAPPSPTEIDAETGRPADPGPAQPALALAPLPIT